MTGRFVYFVQAGAGGPIKIGVADDPRKRLVELQVGSPAELRLVSAIRTDDAAELERDLHARFAPWRVRGEWFSADAEGLDGWVGIVEFDAPVLRLRNIAMDPVEFAESRSALLFYLRMLGKARDYLHAAAIAQAAGDTDSAHAFKIVAVVLNETAQALEHDLEEAA